VLATRSNASTLYSASARQHAPAMATEKHAPRRERPPTLSSLCTVLRAPFITSGVKLRPARYCEEMTRYLQRRHASVRATSQQANSQLERHKTTRAAYAGMSWRCAQSAVTGVRGASDGLRAAPG